MNGLTIVFDLDGTLVDTAPDLVGATNHALASIGLPAVDGRLVRPWISFGARRMIVEALAVLEAPQSEAEVDRLLDTFLAWYEGNIAHQSRPFEGAVESISAARLAGARIAICTNKRESLSHALIEALGLASLFDAIAGRDTFAVSKPHPDHVLGAIRMAGGDACRAVMVGDSGVDIGAARAAGIPVIGCSFGYSETPVRELAPDAVIDHYADFTTALAGILPLLQMSASGSRSAEKETI